MKDSWITKVGLALVALLVVWNIYKGATVQEIGIPGFTFKFSPPKPPEAPAKPQETPPKLPDIEVYGRVVDFEKSVLVGGADVRLTVASTTESQKTDPDGSFYFKVSASESDTEATLDVIASGFQPYNVGKKPLVKIASMQDVYLHALAGGAAGGTPTGGSPGAGKGAVIGATVVKEQEHIQKIKATLPPYQRRPDAARLIPHR